MGNSSSRAEKVEEVPGSETDPAVEEAFSVSVDPALAQDRQQLPRATAVPVVNQQPGPVAGPGGAGPDAHAAAQHWHAVAQKQKAEIDALKQRVQKAYEEGQEKGKASATAELTTGVLAKGVLSEEEEQKAVAARVAKLKQRSEYQAPQREARCGTEYAAALACYQGGEADALLCKKVVDEYFNCALR